MRECRKTCIVINCDPPEIIQQIILIHEIGHASPITSNSDFLKDIPTSGIIENY